MMRKPTRTSGVATVRALAFALLASLAAPTSALAQAAVSHAPAVTAGDAAPLEPTGTLAEDTLHLEPLVREALERNPDIAAMARSYDAMKAKVPQAKAWPEPTVEVGSMGNILPFDVQNDDPSSARAVTVKQEVMWPGKLSLMGKMAGAEAQAEWWAYEAMRRDVVAEVKAAYFDLWYLTKAVDVTSKNKTLMERMAKIAEARYAVGKGMQTDVLKAQLEVSMMLEKLAMLEQRRDAARARLNTLLYRDPDSPLGVPAEVVPEEFAYSIEELKEIALANSPILKRQKQRIDKEEYGVRLAEKDFYPDFEVSYAYQNRPGMPEMHGLMFGMKLPLYFWQKQRPALAEASANAAAERKRFESNTATLYFKIKDLYLMAETAGRLMELYESALVPQSTLTLESSIASYETGATDFLMLLDTLVTLRTYELGYYEQLAAREKAVAMLEPLVGSTLRK
jgi:outer membrane protein TolC